MKVVSKFAVAFFAASVVCLCLFAYALAHREAARLERIMAADLQSYGAGLGPTLERAWTDAGFAGAERVVLAFAPDGAVRATLQPADATATQSREARTEILDDGGHRRLRATFPIAGPNAQRATLTLERTITDGETIIRDELVAQLLAISALAVVMAALAAILGGVLIGRPLGRIVAQAHRIGQGDLSQRLRATRTDEIGMLKRELNAMCDRLVEAHARIDEESTARIETLEKLRHLDRLRTVGTIASGIAHELGTPLNILLLRGQSLAKGELDGPDARDAGVAVVNQVQKMSAIVRQLLDFARTHGAAAATRREVDLAEVAQHASSLLVSMAKKHGVTISVEAKERLLVQADFRQIEQALTNLIVNAIQAMPKGGRLDVRAFRESGAVVIEVDDEGEGMPEDVRAKVFDPFFTTKLDGHGTGLGLHVARGIVEEHGGTIRVGPERERGTKFTLRLPETA